MIAPLVYSHYVFTKAKQLAEAIKKACGTRAQAPLFSQEQHTPRRGLLFLIALHKSDSPPHILLRPSSRAIGPAPELRRIPLSPFLPSRISSKGLLMVSAPLSVLFSVRQLSRHHLHHSYHIPHAKSSLSPKKGRFLLFFPIFLYFLGWTCFFPTILLFICAKNCYDK